jgi:hypothetical protein
LANDPSEHAPQANADEPFEVLWPKYIDRVNKSVMDAEQHLEVPPGTISSIPNDPDFIATVKTYAVIEPILNELITKCQPQLAPLAFALAPTPVGYEDFVVSLNISGRSGKLNLAQAFGLLTNDRALFIGAVARVRNRYAHNVKNMHRSLAEILTEEQQNNKQIVKQLTGVEGSPDGAKIFMYFQLADYLAEALQTLRPPPLPPTVGLSGLGALFNNPPPNTD